MVTLPRWISGILKKPRQLEIKEDVRSSESWRRISTKPYSAVFMTPMGNLLSTQTVLIESDSAASSAESTAGTAPTRKVIIYGVVGHPYVPDTIMREGFTFVYENDEYRCVDVIKTVGEVQGIWEISG
jgi:hypothetical protein